MDIKKKEERIIQKSHYFDVILFHSISSEYLPHDLFLQSSKQKTEREHTANFKIKSTSPTVQLRK